MANLLSWKPAAKGTAMTTVSLHMGSANSSEPHIPICSGEPFEVDASTSGRWRTQAHRKASILAASRMLLAERGVGGFHIRTVAHRSGVTPPTIYSLIGSRDCVLRRAIDEAIDAKFRVAALQSASLGVDLLLSYADISCSCISENPDYYRRILRAMSQGPSQDLRGALLTTARRNTLLHLRAMHRTDKVVVEFGALEVIADILVQQNYAAAVLWADGGIELESLRRQLILGAGLILVGMTVNELRPNIRFWMERLSATERQEARPAPESLTP